MKESLVSMALKRFKNNIASYVAVGVLCGLFFILVSMLYVLDEVVFIIAIPVLALPFLFASHVSCYLLEADQPITIGSFCRYFISFFRQQFRGSFRAIISFLKSLLVYIVFFFIAYLSLYLVFSNRFGDSFTNAANGLLKLYSSGSSFDEMVNYLQQNNGHLLTFIIYASTIPLPFAIVFFLYSISFSSLSIYYRANINSGAPSLLRLAIANTYARYKRSMRKDWFKLNYLLLVLPIVGAIISYVIYYFIIKDINYLPASIVIGAIAPLFFFLPFYFANMEVLYHRYENVFKEGNKTAIEMFLSRIQSSIELSEEEKRQLEESFKEDEEKKE